MQRTCIHMQYLMCVDRSDGTFSWSPIKVSRSAVKVGNEDSSGASDLDINECFSFDYQPRDGVSGFEIETKEDLFRAPVAHRTRKHPKTTHRASLAGQILHARRKSLVSCL